MSNIKSTGDVMTDRLIPIKDVVELVSISPATIYRMRQRREFPEPAVTSGQIVRWRLSDIQYYIQHGEPPTQDATTLKQPA